MPPRRIKNKKYQNKNSNNPANSENSDNNNLKTEPNNLPKFDPQEIQDYEKLRTAMASNLLKYQVCRFSTISGFDKPNLNNLVLKSLRHRILEERKESMNNFFNSEKQTEKEARQSKDRQKQYENDLRECERIRLEMKKLENLKQQKEKMKHMLFTRLKSQLGGESGTSLQAASGPGGIPHIYHQNLSTNQYHPQPHQASSYNSQQHGPIQSSNLSSNNNQNNTSNSNNNGNFLIPSGVPPSSSQNFSPRPGKSIVLGQSRPYIGQNLMRDSSGNSVFLGS